MKLRRLLSCILALLLASSLPLTAFAAEYDLAQGSVTVNASESGQTVTHGSNAAVPDSAPVITQSNNETPTNNTVTITAAADTTANVTLDGVNIDTGTSGGAAVEIKGNGDVVIELDGTNTVQSGNSHAGVEKNTTDDSGKGELTITDENGTDGSLNATGGISGAGIGGGWKGSGSNITISGGTVEATGGYGGSGIGGGYKGSGSDITISGGTVEATGGNFGSGIGGGASGTGSNITISGGTVEATGGENGSGIGGGNGGSGSGITISDSAVVTTQGGWGGSGIGGGYSGSGSNITISGGTVEATGGGRGAGIGGGYSGIGSNIKISGGTVEATGGGGGAGIGGGWDGSGSDITISGGKVEATGGGGGAGIGGGVKSGTGSDITVSGDAQVKAQGGNSSASSNRGTGAAIGGGGNFDSINGQEANVNTDALNEGWIAKYAPGTNLDTAAPNSLTYKDTNGTVTTEEDSQKISIVSAVSATADTHGHESGFQVGDKLVAVTTHNYGNYQSDDNATCTQDGTESAKCTVPDCNAKLERTIPGTMLAHEFVNYVPDANNLATCTKAGTKTAKCEHCTATNTIPDPAKGHSFTNYISDGKATCTQDGSKTAQCDHGCGLTDTKPDVGSALGHSFTNYISDGNATYEQDGTKTARCDHCDATDTIPDPGSRLLWPEEAPRLDSLYQVLGQDGKILACQTAWKDGVLTITVDADFATLTGSFSGMKTLQEQGIDTIVFETNGASSTFALSDLLAQGSTGDTYHLTHDGETVTFTLGSGTDISKIL